MLNRSKVGSLLFFAFAVYIGALSFLPGLVKALIVLRSCLISYYFAFRHPAKIQSGRLQQALAYTSSIIPLTFPFLLANTSSVAPLNISMVLFILGNCLSACGVHALGRSFGVSAAKRELVIDGPYRFFKHPIYFGYVVSELAFLLQYFGPITVFVVVLSASLYFMRARLEDRILMIEV